MKKSAYFAQTLLAVWLGHFCVDFMVGIWPIYKSMAQIDLATAGLIAAFCVTLGEGLQIFFGYLADKGYQRSLLMLGVFLACSAALLPYAPTLTLCVMLCLGTSLGSAAFHPPATGMLGSLSQRRKGMMILFFYSGGALGMAMSQITFTSAYGMFHGHTWPLLLLPVGLLLFLFFHTLPARAEQQAEFNLRMFWQFFKRRDLSYLYMTQVAVQMVFWSLIFLLPDILLAKGTSSGIIFGGGHWTLTMGSFVMLLPAGYLVDRYSPRRLMLLSTLLSFVLLVLFLAVGNMPPLLLLALLFVLGGSLGVINPIAVSLGNRLVPENPAMVSAFLMGLVWCVTESLGPGFSGVLTKLFADNAPIKAMGLMTFFLFWGIYSLYRLPEEEEESVELALDA